MEAQFLYERTSALSEDYSVFHTAKRNDILISHID
jgi:hypothetical protein